MIGCEPLKISREDSENYEKIYRFNKNILEKNGLKLIVRSEFPQTICQFYIFCFG